MLLVNFSSHLTQRPAYEFVNLINGEWILSNFSLVVEIKYLFTPGIGGRVVNRAGEYCKKNI